MLYKYVAERNISNKSYPCSWINDDNKKLIMVEISCTKGIVRKLSNNTGYETVSYSYGMNTD